MIKWDQVILWLSYPINKILDFCIRPCTLNKNVEEEMAFIYCINHRFYGQRIWFTIFNFSVGISPNLDVNHPTLHTGNSLNPGLNLYLEVIWTVAIYIPAGNSPSLDVYHHLDVIRTRDYLHPNRELTQPWCKPLPWMIGTMASYITPGSAL